MDRTADFQRIVAERRGGASSSAAPPTIPLAPPTRRAAARRRSQRFPRSPTSWGWTQLAQSRSLFDEEGQGQEISALTFIIKQDITALNSRPNELQQARWRRGAKQRRALDRSSTR